jgi:hypothetical protein
VADPRNTLILVGSLRNGAILAWSHHPVNCVSMGVAMCRSRFVLALAVGLCLASVSARSAPITNGCAGSTCTMQELFDGGSFESDNLLFSGFRPFLSPNLPSGSEISANPLLFLSLLLPFDGTSDAIFSRGWGNASAASASGVTVTPEGDDLTTTAVDPGFGLSSPALAVNAGNTPSLQLSSYAYEVKRVNAALGGPITSTLLEKAGSSYTTGPDQLFPFDFDFAFGGALQIALDDGGNFLGANLVGDLFANLFGSDVDVLPGIGDAASLGFADQDAVQIVTLLGIGATSGGTFDLGTITERIDPPGATPGGSLPVELTPLARSAAAVLAVPVPLPAPLLLVALGLPLLVAAPRALRARRGRKETADMSSRNGVAVALAAIAVVSSTFAVDTRAGGREVTRIVYDSFEGPGYDINAYLGKWNNGFGLGEMAVADTRTFDGSTFSISALPFQTAFDFSVFDHIKYLALSNQSFAVPAHGSVTFSATIDATVIGTQPEGRTIYGVYGPPGCAEDPSCAAGAEPWQGVALEGQQAGATLHMIDFATGQLFDWFISGSTAFALIERLPATVTGSPGGGTIDTSYTQIVKEVEIGPGPHEVSITFFRNAGTSYVDYVLDGKRVARVKKIGVPLDVQNKKYTGIYPSLGPGEELGEQINFLTIGHGLFSLLDAFPFQHPDAPEQSVSISISERIFGQGAGAIFDDFVVTIDERR